MAKKYILVEDDDEEESKGCFKELIETVGGIIFLVLIYLIVKAGCGG